MPFPDGDDHGDADEEFASVVFDEAFVKAAAFRELSARERLLAAAQARAEADAARARVGADDDGSPDGYRTPGSGGYDATDLGLYTGHYGHRRPYGSQARWHRSVAWLLAVIMGLGVVALTFAAVYRGAGGSARPPAPTPPATGRVEVSRPPVEVGSPAVR